MKKSYLLICLLFLTTFLQAEVQYVEKTLKTYSLPTDSKPSGKVLPTTPLEVIKVEGDKAFVKITGWNRGKLKRILYYSKGVRIISAAFSKKAKNTIKTIQTVTPKNSKKPWTQVTLTTWVNNKNLINDIKPLYKEAKNLLEVNCGLCHAPHPTHEFSANQWPAVIKGMAPRTPLNKEQVLLISQFAQKHSKD